MKLKSTSRFLLDGFLYVLVFPLIIRRARGEGSRAFNLEEYLLTYYLQDEIKDEFHPTITDKAILSDNNEYPYEQLLNFVKETKRLLQSPYSVNDERKKILQKNFGRHYSAYLQGDNSDVPCHNRRNCPPVPALGLEPPPPPPLPYGVPAFRPLPSLPANPSIPPSNIPYYNKSVASATADSDRPRAPVPVQPPVVNDAKPEINPCEQIVRFVRPQRLKSVDGKEHFILNLGNEFVQEVKIIQCRCYQGQCGDETTWPENYEKVCEQSYDSYKTLFSVPVNKEINILDQNLHIFQVSNGCHCKLKKKSR